MDRGLTCSLHLGSILTIRTSVCWIQKQSVFVWDPHHSSRTYHLTGCKEFYCRSLSEGVIEAVNVKQAAAVEGVVDLAVLTWHVLDCVDRHVLLGTVEMLKCGLTNKNKELVLITVWIK